MTGRFRTVDAILRGTAVARPVRKSDLGLGDCVIVRTENSIYSMEVVDDCTFRVRGGWFDRQHLSPASCSVSGCTWGGTAIQRDLVAGCGLHLEFGNHVVTSRVLEVLVIRAAGGLRPVHASELLADCYGRAWESVRLS